MQHSPIDPAELPVLPPTQGIQKQPSAQELAAIAAAHPPTQKTTNTTVLIAAACGVLALVLIVGGFGISLFSGKNQLSEEVIELAVPQEADLAEVAELEQQASLIDTMLTGAYLENSSTQISTPFDITWKDRGIEFALVAAHDLGTPFAESQNTTFAPEYEGKRILLLEVQAVDARLTGGEVVSNAGDYVALRHEQTDLPAVEWREDMLSPGETKTFYVLFALSPTVSEYFILAGDLRNPHVLPMTTESSINSVQEASFN